LRAFKFHAALPQDDKPRCWSDIVTPSQENRVWQDAEEKSEDAETAVLRVLIFDLRVLRVTRSFLLTVQLGAGAR
jgi:hypothetical protein